MVIRQALQTNRPAARTGAIQRHGDLQCSSIVLVSGLGPVNGDWRLQGGPGKLAVPDSAA